MSKNKEHFWIPEGEVQKIDKTLRGSSKPRNIEHKSHGSRLSTSLQSIKKTIEKNNNDNSLNESDIVIFKVEFPQGEKAQNKEGILNKNGMQIRAVKNEQSAVVSTTKRQFQILQSRVATYTNSGKGKTYFEEIGTFDSYSGSEKNSNQLQKNLNQEELPETLDIQIMLVPNLNKQIYEQALPKIEEKIKLTNGIRQEEIYYLSDNTPVLRVIIPSSMLSHYENDFAIYRIEETNFFSAHGANEPFFKQETFSLKNDVVIDTLPLVTVLDSGVSFPEQLTPLIVQHWTPHQSIYGDCMHGTKVASRVAFKYLSRNQTNDLIPRARIIDCNIFDGKVPVNVLISRIQLATCTFSDISKVYNLSINTDVPIEGDEMSILGYELDALQLKENVQFVISAGNHDLWKTESCLEDILDDDDSQISSPADSMHSIVVGSIVGKEHAQSLSLKNEIAPYSRRGSGFCGFTKPDMSAYSGTIVSAGTSMMVPIDDYSIVLNKSGQLVPDAGTSFSAPIVSGDLAEILSIVPDESILLSKALLYHNAIPVWDSESMEEDELVLAHNLYGRGLSSVNDSKFSSPHKATFVRTGVLNRVTKERINIYMPDILAAQVGKNVAKVTVTCLSMPPIDRTKGTEYLGAYIRASLKKAGTDSSKLLGVQPTYKEGRQKWDVCHQFSKLFTTFNAGDWQIWLELFSRWDNKNQDIPYALVVTIEDVSQTLDIYSEIKAQNRYQALNTVRARARN